MSLHDRTSQPVQRRWLGRAGVTIVATTPLARAVVFADSVLRGIGQVMLQDNAYTGLLFLIGVCWNSTLLGLAVLVGATASTATACLLGMDRAQIRSGCYGFNGALLGVALLYFLIPNPLTWGYVLVGAACSTVLMAALTRWLARGQLPAFTAPFVVTTLLFILAAARFGRLGTTDLLPTAGLPTAAAVEGVVSGATLWRGLCNGLAEVFFQQNVVTGLWFAVGLLVGSRRAFAAAIMGSLVGLLTAWLLGAAEPAIRAGAFGFNAVLTAIALASNLRLASIRGIAYLLLGTVAATIVFAAVSAALQPIGMPALTAPFVIVTWLFLLAARGSSRLRAA